MGNMLAYLVSRHCSVININVALVLSQTYAARTRIRIV